MNKKEWKAEYGAARLMIHTCCCQLGQTWHKRTIAQKRLWDICFSVIQKMHPSIGYAMFDKADCFYSIKKFKWAAKHNSRQFHAIRVKNEIDRIKRKEHNND